MKENRLGFNFQVFNFKMCTSYQEQSAFTQNRKKKRSAHARPVGGTVNTTAKHYSDYTRRGSSKKKKKKKKYNFKFNIRWYCAKIDMFHGWVHERVLKCFCILYFISLMWKKKKVIANILSWAGVSFYFQIEKKCHFGIYIASMWNFRKIMSLFKSFCFRTWNRNSWIN